MLLLQLNLTIANVIYECSLAHAISIIFDEAAGEAEAHDASAEVFRAAANPLLPFLDWPRKGRVSVCILVFYQDCSHLVLCTSSNDFWVCVITDQNCRGKHTYSSV